MASISGELLAGEARGAARAIAARQRGNSFIYYGVMIALIVGGGLLGRVVGDALEHATPNAQIGTSTTVPAGIALGAVAYLFVGRLLIVRLFRRSMQARGLNPRFDYGLSFDDEAVTLRSGGVTRTAGWAAVTEVFKANNYWVFLVQTEPWFAPSRFFAGADDERAFLREALAHMSQDARDRSADAVRYAAR